MRGLNRNRATRAMTLDCVRGNDVDLGVADSGDVGWGHRRATDYDGLNERRVEPGALDGKLVSRIDAGWVDAAHRRLLKGKDLTERERKGHVDLGNKELVLGIVERAEGYSTAD